MATHDYVIDNSTGANVRADLNLVLQAILSNNSSSSAPSTTAAYMWWADTSNGILKIRNSANNGWVELFQLDGTLTLEDGTKTAPALAHRSNLNTGIFFSAANKFNVSTAGVERLELGTETIFNEEGVDVDFRIESDDKTHMFYVDAGNNRIGIGTNSPSSSLEISVGDSGTTSSAGFNEFSIEGGNEDIGMCFLSPAANNRKQTISFGDSNNNNSGAIEYNHLTDDLTFTASDNIILTGDAVLIGISTPRTYEQPEPFGGNDTVPALQIEGAGASAGTHRVFAHTYNNNDVYAPTHIFGKTRGGSTGSVNIVNSGDPLGIISFQGADGVDLEEAAQIRAEVDGTPGSNDMPGRLVFSTTPDDAHAPVTRMTIKSDGKVGIGNVSPGFMLDVRGATSSSLRLGNTGESAHGSHDCKLVSGNTYYQNFDFQSYLYKFQTFTGSTLEEQMRLDQNGHLMLGTDTPVSLLTIDRGTSSSSCIFMTNTDNVAYSNAAEGHINSILVLKSKTTTGQNDQCAAIQFNLELTGQTGSIQEIGAVRTASGAGALIFRTRNSSEGRRERMRIEDKGRTLITQVNSNQVFPALVLDRTDAATNVQNTMITLICNGNDRGQLVSGSSASSSPQLSATSDYRIKENIRDYTDGWNNIKAIPVKLFDVKTDGSKDIKGWIAHEVQPYIPESVIGEKDAVVTQAMVDSGERDESELGDDIMQNLAYGAFMPDVVNALQTAIAKIEVLETKVAALEAA